jgi:SAM-dependent methyltransferase
MPDSDQEFSSGERVYLGHSGSMANEALHVERYLFARQHVRSGDSVLDAASGSGFGSELLAQRAAQVVGLELNQHALAYAVRHHSLPNIDYIRADLNVPVPIRDGSFDLIVSFETIEHIEDQVRLIREFSRLLRAGGLAIISTPDRDATSFTNRFHVKELSKAEFVRLLARNLTLKELYGQVADSTSPWRIPLRSVARLDLFEWRSSRLANHPALRGLRQRLQLSSFSRSDPHIELIPPGGRDRYLFLIATASRQDPARV